MTSRAVVEAQDAPKAAHQQNAVAEQLPDATPVGAPAVATGLASTPEAIESETTEFPAEEPSVIATMLAAAIAPFLLPGPNAPAASPLLWAVMAWTRREAEQTVEMSTATLVAETPSAAAPVAGAQYFTHEDTPVTGTLPVIGLLGAHTIDQPPANGTLTVDLLGNFVYTPNTNFHGADSFTYVTAILLGIPSGTIEIAITVLPVNDAPVAANYNLYTSHDRPLTVRVLDDAVDADGDALTSAVLTQPGSGTVVQNPDGSLVYTPDAGFAGDDLFTYSITDPSGMSATGVIWITVRANQSPVSSLQSLYVMTRDGKLVVGAENGVLVDDYDPDGDPVTVVSFGTPTYGTVTWTQDGSFTYTPMAGFTGYDQFTYVLSDSVGATAVGHVMVIIEAPPNQPPVVETAVTLVTEEDLDVTFDPLKGATDPEGDFLYARVESQPKYGFAQQFYDDGGELGGHIAYVPDRGFVGTDTFTYRVFDVYDRFVEVTVTVVVGPSTRPTAVDDEVGVAEGGKVTIDVLKNDLSPRGDALQIDVLAPPVYGKLEYNEKTRTFVYIPTEGANRTTDSFLYEVTDKDGRTSMATVTIKIALKGVGPVARDDFASTPVNTPVVINVLDNDITSGEKPPLVKIDTPPRQGKAEVLKDGTISFTPDKDFVGTAQVGYSLTDPQGNVSHATVTITVYGGGGENPNDKWYTVGKDRTLTVAVPDGLLAGLDSDGWGIGIEVKPRNGTLSLNQDGSFTYTPNKGFVGKDTFDFYTHTSEWGDGPFTVTIEVTEATTEPNPEVNYGTAIALETSSAFGTCGDNLMPGQGAPAEVWPTCLFTTAVRKPSDPW
jgi:CshA-type fibril repeat protein